MMCKEEVISSRSMKELLQERASARSNDYMLSSNLLAPASASQPGGDNGPYAIHGAGQPGAEVRGVAAMVERATSDVGYDIHGPVPRPISSTAATDNKFRSSQHGHEQSSESLRIQMQATSASGTQAQYHTPNKLQRRDRLGSGLRPSDF